jgi:CheY-like chemotaxis protein
VGSTFHFEAEFGLADAESMTPSHDHAELIGTRVLVVDDNPNAREILRSHLEQFGLRPDCCISAGEAFDRLHRADAIDPYRVVLMDYRMPGMDGMEAVHHIKNKLGLAHVPRAVLVTAASRLASEESDGIGQDLDEVLSKPVNASVLYNVVAGVLAGTRSRPASAQRSRGDLDAAALRPIRGARVLLVEDNAINQQVATEMLEQAGLVVELAENGLEALERLATLRYDVVLMDVQMPVMDGYTAAARIRENPAWATLPVLAMTANVMAEDRAKVAQVGMNGHIAKPIVPRELFEALLKWVPHGERETVAEPPAVKRVEPEIHLPAHLPGFDLPKALINVGGNRRLLRKLLADLRSDHRGDGLSVQQAIDQGQWMVAQRLAHTLKGVGGTLAAGDLQHSAAALEMALRSGRTSEAPLLAQRLATALDPLMNGLSQWLGVQAASSDEGEASSTAPGTQADGGDGGSTALPAHSVEPARRLQELFADLDPEAADIATALAEGLPSNHRLHQVARHAANYDFEPARALLAELLAAADQPTAP